MLCQSTTASYYPLKRATRALWTERRINVSGLGAYTFGGVCVCVCVCSSDGVARRSTPSGRTDALAALLVRPDDGVKAEALSVLLEVLRRGTAAWDGATGNDFRRRMMSDGEGFPLAGEITALARKILVWALRMKTPSGPRWS